MSRTSSRASRRRWRGLVAAGVTTSVSALVGGLLAPLAPAAAAPAGPATAAVPTFSWSDCRDGFVCSTAEVPLDHDDPSGASIELSLIKLPAAGGASRRLGSLFLNPGGPGGSGHDFVRYAGKALPLAVRARYDIVGFDPRGIMRSSPLRCFDTLDQAFRILPRFAFPVTTRQEDRQRRFDRALGRACQTHGGAIRDHMSTADVARDLDLLRRAVGDERLNYLGYSYGSMIGSTYANLFPATTGRLVVDAVLDPVAVTTDGPPARRLPVTSRWGGGDSAQATLGEFFRLCDAPDSGCAIAGDAEERYADLAAALRRAPIVIRDEFGEFRFTYADLVAITLGAMTAPYVWPYFAEFIVYLQDLRSEEARTTATRLRGMLLTGAATQEEYPNYVEGFPGVLCSDSTNPTSFATWRRVADQADRRGYFGRPFAWASSVCLSWPASAGQDRYTGPWTAATATTVLVVGNAYDPLTSYAGAVAVSRLLPNSRLLSYGGWGHGAFLAQQSFCVDSTVTAYLVHGRVPAAGASCAAEGSPFGPTEAAAGPAAEAVAAALMPPAVRRGVTDALDGR